MSSRRASWYVYEGKSPGISTCSHIRAKIWGRCDSEFFNRIGQLRTSLSSPSKSLAQEITPIGGGLEAKDLSHRTVEFRRTFRENRHGSVAEDTHIGECRRVGVERNNSLCE